MDNLEAELGGVYNRILEQRRVREEARSQVVEHEQEWAKAANRLFSTEDGQLFIKYLLRFSNIFTVDNSLAPATLIENNGKRAIYLKLIRPYLNDDVRALVENQK